MDTMAAFFMGQSARAAGKKRMVFDWDKAAEIIKQRGAYSASAGLSGDWENTGGTILAGGSPVLDDYTYLSSIWATPQLYIDGVYIDCFIDESDVPEAWGTDFASIKWPMSALEILGTVHDGAVGNGS